MLLECGLCPLYKRHPFDGRILHCANSTAPIGAFHQFNRLRYSESQNSFRTMESIFIPPIANDVYSYYECKEETLMSRYLPINYILKFHKRSGEYTITGVIGEGASTIAYLASYKDGSERVSKRIIKEYFPCDLNHRRVHSPMLCIVTSFIKAKSVI